MPASDSRRMASSRRCGVDARGSSCRASLRSSVVIDSATLTSPFSAIGLRMSMSRVTRWFLVTIATGWLWRASTSRIERVMPRLRSMGWYGSVFVPSAMVRAA